MRLQLQRRRNKISEGWDPISAQHAMSYAEQQWKALEEGTGVVLDQVENWAGGYKGKRVLDLGAGPGQFSIGMALRGAEVTWHDPSTRYMNLARQRAGQLGVQLQYSLGYLEDAEQLKSNPFDIVFNRLCWIYAINDFQFSKMIWDLTKPGGSIYIAANNRVFSEKEPKSMMRAISHLVYDLSGMKIAYDYARRGKFLDLMQRFPFKKLVCDYSYPQTDVLFIQK